MTLLNDIWIGLKCLFGLHDYGDWVELHHKTHEKQVEIRCCYECGSMIGRQSKIEYAELKIKEYQL